MIFVGKRGGISTSQLHDAIAISIVVEKIQRMIFRGHILSRFDDDLSSDVKHTRGKPVENKSS